MSQLADKPVLRMSQTKNQETCSLKFRKTKLIVLLRLYLAGFWLYAYCLCAHALKWQNPVFQWLKASSTVQFVWIYWRIQWRLTVDTVTVWAVLQVTGIRMIRRESTAALSADRPSLQDLFYVKTPCWLKWWRIWGRENSKPFSLMTIMVNLEMWSVTSVLRRKTNPSSPVWCVWNLTVRIILSITKNFTQKSDTKWLMPLDNWRRWSALYMIGC